MTGTHPGTRPGRPSTAPFRATLGRSVALFAAFRGEQTDPDHFYGTLARDTVAQLRSYTPLDGAVVVDVGGGPGYFSDELRAAGARCVCVDADAGELRLRDGRVPDTAVLGSALDMPMRTGSVDVCFSSNVLEHVPDPQRMADEMVRVTRPGGTVYLSYTLWLSPWGGHETSPWHYLGGRYAADRFARKHGRRPKNDFGSTMFAVSAAEMLRWATTRTDVDVIDILPRYLPTWMKPIIHIPGLREIVTWNLLLVLRKR
ncbi:ubiquinone/menaquinone biosynthesis C-methylase UbiE [Nocardiopsis mwathae]|uniref:Ubiquinone/menaquinone biosynthesis C-methylase UbiE n=1 Tax=Nocardiopsis mwathae TaxID=1472723 RepID=A0A7W9YDQ5_9ACTN|nr:class I SAM-dependent methyltransferase [Nocardiopsis mwathae]MBB6170189.1 ubiquinone/menaquinone biosynthesis C-methylase UbiE [Nocardiopsis mwathae]